MTEKEWLDMYNNGDLDHFVEVLNNGRAYLYRMSDDVSARLINKFNLSEMKQIGGAEPTDFLSYIIGIKTYNHDVIYYSLNDVIRYLPKKDYKDISELYETFFLNNPNYNKKLDPNATLLACGEYITASEQKGTNHDKFWDDFEANELSKEEIREYLQKYLK